MSEMGQRRRSQYVRNESAYPPIAAGEQTSRLVGSVPRADHDLPAGLRSAALRVVAQPLLVALWQSGQERLATSPLAMQPCQLGVE